MSLMNSAMGDRLYTSKTSWYITRPSLGWLNEYQLLS